MGKKKVGETLSDFATGYFGIRCLFGSSLRMRKRETEREDFIRAHPLNSEVFRLNLPDKSPFLLSRCALYFSFCSRCVCVWKVTWVAGLLPLSWQDTDEIQTWRVPLLPSISYYLICATSHGRAEVLGWLEEGNGSYLKRLRLHGGRTEPHQYY